MNVSASSGGAPSAATLTSTTRGVRKAIFRDTKTGAELIMPVTPMPLEAEEGSNIELTNISQLGDVSYAGTPTLANITAEFLLPAQRYPFCVAAPLDPYAYIEKFRKWRESKTVLRYIWSGTKVNIPVLIESVRYREDDGTNDVRVTVNMREYRYVTAELEPLSNSVLAQEPQRADEEPTSAEQIHNVVWGDTLWGICRTYYGDPLLYPQVASYNKIKNANLIYVGDIIKIPPRSVLDAMKG